MGFLRVVAVVVGAAAAVSAHATVPAPDLGAMFDEAAHAFGPMADATRARLQALTPQTPDAERLDVVLRAVVQIVDPRVNDALRPHLAEAEAIARREGLLAAEALVAAARFGPMDILAATTRDQVKERVKQLKSSVQTADRSGDAAARCLTRYLLANGILAAEQSVSEAVAALTAAAGLAEAAPRCAAVVLAELAIGVVTYNVMLGNVVSDESLEQDLGYVARAQRLAPADAFPAQAAFAQFARGMRLLHAKRFAEGEADCRRAKVLGERTGGPLLMARVLTCFGAALVAQGHFREGVVPLQQSTALAAVTGELQIEASAAMLLAQAYTRIPPIDLAAIEGALRTARHAVDALGPRGARAQVKLMKVSATVYALLGDLRRAYELSDAATEATATTFGKAQLENIADVTGRLDLKGKQADIEMLELREAQAATRRNALLAGLAVAVVGLVAVGVLLRRQVLQKRKIARLHAQLEGLNADRSRSLAAACHDLRQPAYALSLLAEAAASSAASPEAAAGAAARYLDDIRRNSLVLGDMLSALMDLSQLERGDYVPALAPVDLDELLGEAVLQYRAAAARRRLSLQAVPSGVWVHSDPHLLRRVVFNLISNACKYTDAGSVQLDVVVTDGRARIRVADTGRGMPADRIDDMLRAYTRLDHGAAEEGLGIGLSVVQRATSLLGHALHIESTVGRGTTVTVEATVTYERPTVPAPGVQAGAPVRGVVAVVDDNPEIRQAMVSLLSEWGVDSVAAASRDGLLQALLERGVPVPALLLTDYQLGDEDGLELVQRLRSRPGWAALPALLVTGNVSPETEAHARSMGVRVLLKPARPARLRRAMADAAVPIEEGVPAPAKPAREPAGA